MKPIPLEEKLPYLWDYDISRKRGFDFLVEWLPRRHPELLR